MFVLAVVFPLLGTDLTQIPLPADVAVLGDFVTQRACMAEAGELATEYGADLEAVGGLVVCGTPAAMQAAFDGVRAT